MKVSELSGALLDYWVARSLGWEKGTNSKGLRGWARLMSPIAHNCRVADWDGVWVDPLTPAFSTDWSEGGPIIERERLIIGTRQRMADTGRWTHLHWVGRAYNPTNRWNNYAPGFAGDTPLVAAMRSFVASKFGEEVPAEVPTC